MQEGCFTPAFPQAQSKGVCASKGFPEEEHLQIRGLGVGKEAGKRRRNRERGKRCKRDKRNEQCSRDTVTAQRKTEAHRMKEKQTRGWTHGDQKPERKSDLQNE